MPIPITSAQTGDTTPPRLNTFSTIAITPGYGIAHKTNSSQITIPAMAFNSLKSGTYYLFLMGTDGNNNIVALDEGQVSIQSGSQPTIIKINQTLGYPDATVNFTLSGSNFPAQLGTGAVNVTLTKIRNTTITSTILSVTSSNIIGYFEIPHNVDTNGTWNVVLTTNDYGQQILTGAGFTITPLPTPKISSVAPLTALQDSTIYFTVTGNNLTVNGPNVQMAGSTMTWVNFTNVTRTRIFDNVNITINSVTPTSINGTMVIGADASPGKWNLTATTIYSVAPPTSIRQYITGL